MELAVPSLAQAEERLRDLGTLQAEEKAMLGGLLANLQMRQVLAEVQAVPAEWKKACVACLAMKKAGRIPTWEQEAKVFWSYVLGQGLSEKDAALAEEAVREVRRRWPGDPEAQALVRDAEGKIRRLKDALKGGKP